MCLNYNLNKYCHLSTGVSCPSVSSEVSCDYADPPDETSDKSDLESLEPEKKLLRYATDNHKLVTNQRRSLIHVL